jgi:hypothetical protein
LSFFINDEDDEEDEDDEGLERSLGCSPPMCVLGDWRRNENEDRVPADDSEPRACEPDEAATPATEGRSVISPPYVVRR